MSGQNCPDIGTWDLIEIKASRGGSLIACGMQNLEGLSSQRAAALLAKYGSNALPAAPRPLILTRFLQQFLSPLIYVLLFALAVDLLSWMLEGMLEVPLESLAIALILILNAGLGAYQEHKADEALAKTRALGAQHAWALRDGTLQRLRSEVLVPGDVVRLEAGDKVPADAEIIKAQSVSVDEAIITGESLPVEKSAGSELLSGTLVVRGKTYARITRTGAQSNIGRLAGSLKHVVPDITPLERRIKQFARLVAIIILVMAVLLTVGGLYFEGLSRFGHVIIFSVALAVAAIPEGLPAVLTVALAIGVQRMAGRNALVRKMTAVETLGSITVIASDKTGTLTENRMTVREVDTPDPDRAFVAMLLANDANLESEAGDSVDLALMAFARHNGKNAYKILGTNVRVASRPFDSSYKFMSVTVNDGNKDATYVKGAPEALLARSRISKKQKEEWERKAQAYAAKGLRVLAMAWAPGSRDEKVNFLGLIAMWDPPRAEAMSAIRIAKEAGIRVVMITGDHPATAAFTAETVGIDGQGVLTGERLSQMHPRDLQEQLGAVSIYARVLPEHKLRLVDNLKADGQVVAVTGDGVNDALAIKRADVGIAMGKRGSDVSREVADIVLLDDNFATIVSAIEEGRSIYENIVKFVCFFLSTELALVLLVAIGLSASVFFNYRDAAGNILLPLTAVQLLWINVVADGPPALALALDRNPGIMALPPRPPRSPLLTRSSLIFIAVSGLVKALLGLAIFILLPGMGYSLAETQTSVFLYEAIVQLVFAYPVRHLHVKPLTNYWLHVAVLGGAVVQVAAVALDPLRQLLGLTALRWEDLAAVSFAVLLSWGLAEVVSLILRRDVKSQRLNEHPARPS